MMPVMVCDDLVGKTLVGCVEFEESSRMTLHGSPSSVAFQKAEKRTGGVYPGEPDLS